MVLGGLGRIAERLGMDWGLPWERFGSVWGANRRSLLYAWATSQLVSNVVTNKKGTSPVGDTSGERTGEEDSIGTFAPLTLP